VRRGELGIAVGIYSVMAFNVAERTREIAIRIALGARPSQIVGQVLTRAIAYVVLGLTLGVVGAAGLATLIKSFLFDVLPHDVGVYALVALTLVSAGLVAAWLPARRAATVDPLVFLKRS
jgi:ABC-type antimicrobial peptide transport system permease subunit